MLVTLAEAVEQASREGGLVAQLLDDLDEATDQGCRQSVGGSSTIAPEHLVRWRRVVASVRRDVESGRVRSVSGIAREARRYAVLAGQHDRVAVPT